MSVMKPVEHSNKTERHSCMHLCCERCATQEIIKTIMQWILRHKDFCIRLSSINKKMIIV